MWKPYLNVLAQEVSGAIHVLDRFHIMQVMNNGTERRIGANSAHLVSAS
jgi:transposase